MIKYLNGRIILILFKKVMRFLTATLLLLLPLTCLSWWDVGHMLTAAIAEAKLLKEDSFAVVTFRELIYSIN